MNFSTSCSLSPASLITAMTLLTGIFLQPASTSRRATTPSSAHSNSITALSVSISAISEPGSTLSPFLTHHRARVPSFMVGESAGIRRAIGMMIFRLCLFFVFCIFVFCFLFFIAEFFDATAYLLDVGQGEGFEVSCVWQRNIFGGYSHYWCVEPIEGLFVHLRGDFASDCGEAPAFFDDEHAVSFTQGFDEGWGIEGSDSSEIDNFAFDSLFFELGNAACNAIPSIRENATIVAWLPLLTTAAFPMGSSSCGFFSTGNFSPYKSSCSRKTTGLSSLIAALSKAFASAAE